MSSYVFKLTAGKEFKADKDFGFQGRIVNCKLLKTRSGYNATTLPLVYHSKLGFHNPLTSVIWFKENGVLKKSGTSFFLPSMPDVKFMQRDFMKHYRTNEEFQEGFDAVVAETFQRVIDEKNTGDYDDGSSAAKYDEEFED